MKPSFSTTFFTAAMCVLVGCNRPGAALHTLCVLVALVERNSAAWLPELTDATWDKLLQSLFRKAHQAGGAVARMAMLCLERMTANPFWLNSHSFVSRLVNCMCQAGASVQGAPATALCASVLKRIAMSGEAMGHIVGKAVCIVYRVPHLTLCIVSLTSPHTHRGALETSHNYSNVFYGVVATHFDVNVAGGLRCTISPTILTHRP